MPCGKLPSCVIVGSLSLGGICYPLGILAPPHCHSLGLEPPLGAWGGQWAAAATFAWQGGSFQNTSVLTSSRRTRIRLKL